MSPSPSRSTTSLACTRARAVSSMRRSLAALLFAVVCGCSPPKPEPSLQAFKGLLSSLRAGDLERLWPGLSSESRAWLLIELGLPATPETLTLSSPPGPLKEAISLQPGWRFEHSWGERAQREPQGDPSDERAWFRFTEHGRLWRVRGVRRDDGWRFDLFHATVPSPSDP